MAAKLNKAIKDGDVEALEGAVGKANVNEQDKKGYTPLMECAKAGFHEGIPLLLAAGNHLCNLIILNNIYFLL